MTANHCQVERCKSYQENIIKKKVLDWFFFKPTQYIYYDIQGITEVEKITYQNSKGNTL